MGDKTGIGREERLLLTETHTAANLCLAETTGLSANALAQSPTREVEAAPGMMEPGSQALVAGSLDAASG